MKKITLLFFTVFALNLQMKAQITTYPYSEDFEDGAGNWIADNTTSGSWELGTPLGEVISGAASGTMAWNTNLTDIYNNNENSSVTSPEFDFSALTSASITVNIWWDSENSFDGTVFQSSIDGRTTWQNVGTQGDLNWFNDGGIDGNPGDQTTGWTGTGSLGSGGYVSATQELSGLAGQASVYLRFAFGSDDSSANDGFAFDDVVITSETLSNKNFDNSPLFTYYPNPVNDILILNAQKNISKIFVFNMLGQEVLRNVPNAINSKLYLSTLKPGAYFVKITVGKVTQAIRIIKN